MFRTPSRAALAALLVLAAAAPAAARDADDRPWTVTRVSGGYRVALDLTGPLAVTDGAPVLKADGRTLGPAAESADGTTLSLVTTDPAVLTAASVTTDAPLASDAARTAPTAAPAAVLAADPAAPGTHRVSEAVYDFGDQVLPLLNDGGTLGELEGKIYLPDGAGRKPVVVFLHGRHSACYGPGTPNPAGWPCTDDAGSTAQRFPIPSYLGYEQPARALASHGYAVVSISANAINATDNQKAADYGAQARGGLVLDTLRMLERADAGKSVRYHDAFTGKDTTLAGALSGDLAPADLRGRLDLGDVGIMGHSRGGEGVVAAATLNDALPVAKQFGIKAVLPLAPVDYDRISLPDAVTATVLPYCDGDVENLMGQHIVDDSRHAFDDNVLRSAVLVQGANHNFFNTVWTPGGWPAGTSDDWSYAPASDDPTCNPSAAGTTRLTAPQQEAVGTAYIAGFFRMALGGESAFRPMFDGSGAVPASVSFAGISVAATQPAGSRRDLATFRGDDPNVRVSGSATAVTCADMGGTGGTTIPGPRPACTTTLDEAAVPHWSPALWAWNVTASPMLHLRWAGSDGAVSVALPRGRRDLSGYRQLSLKTAADESVATGTDLTVTVTDGRGRRWSAPVSTLNAAAVRRLPGTTSPWLRKILLQQVTLPLSALRGLDLTDIREVRFTGAAGAGGVYLSDLSAETPAVGGRVAKRQATVDIAPARVEEGAGPGVAHVAAVLSGPVRHEVTAYVSVFGTADGKVASTVRKVVFAPGTRCVAVPVAIHGDAVAGPTASSVAKVSATNVSGAVMGRAGFGTLTLREDDGVSDGAASAPAVGPHGDVCAGSR